MKKLVSVFLVILLFSFTESAAVTDPVDNDVDLEGYSRIYKEDDVWYGVIEVTETYLNSGFVAYSEYVNTVGIAFSRDTDSLNKITITYTVSEDSCDGWILPWIGCIGGYDDPVTETIEIYNSYDSGTWEEFILGDQILTALDSSIYDYWFYIWGELIETIDVVSYYYVLTYEEVSDVLMDIQAQYNREYYYIISNPDLNLTEKELALIELDQEYAEYSIDYGEAITSYCLDNPECSISNEDTSNLIDPDTVDDFKTMVSNFFENVLSIVVYGIVGLFSGAVILTFVVKLVSKGTGSALQGIGYTTWTGIKLGGRSGAYWGDQLLIGSQKLVGYFWIGLKSIFRIK